MKKSILLWLLVTFWLAVALPAEASFCRNLNNHEICIVSIKRSAKNYWEYRVVISVDGEKKPLEVYDCRSRVKIQADGQAVFFESNGAGNFICSYFSR
ncbi:MAG: hypothetical protein SAL07_08620 [Oscillatoria sp. PMC 1051.18]|nr:hypothetical protein [Oscillatoria sp. PMC 1050.18]MEC5029962.1 hypothetical protein [Oscillatoria sp. PMC 1051.18]